MARISMQQGQNRWEGTTSARGNITDRPSIPTADRQKAGGKQKSPECQATC
ncbi:MAG: hypothetical protein R3C49_02585 [Planctomycetaceae bacterium]